MPKPAFTAVTALSPTLIVGYTVDFTETVPDYPASDGWTLKYRLIPRLPGNDVIDVTATAVGDDYRVLLAPAVTALWDAGDYGWYSWVEKTGAKHDWRSGQVEIMSDPGSIAAGTDTRSPAQKAVDDCLAALADVAATMGALGTTGRLVKRYVIGNRELEYEGTGAQVQTQLSGLLAFWQGRLAAENAAKNVQAGLADRRRIYLRAGRA